MGFCLRDRPPELRYATGWERHKILARAAASGDDGPGSISNGLKIAHESRPMRNNQRHLPKRQPDQGRSPGTFASGFVIRQKPSSATSVQLPIKKGR